MTLLYAGAIIAMAFGLLFAAAISVDLVRNGRLMKMARPTAEPVGPLGTALFLFLVLWLLYTSLTILTNGASAVCS